MIDQLNSHAQIGVSITATSTNDSSSSATNDGGHGDSDTINRHSNYDQKVLMEQVGSALGSEIKKLLPPMNKDGSSSSRFCCPLDEALVECIMERHNNNENKIASLEEFNLPPYGIFPKGTGRTEIGSMQTAPLIHFFESLSQSSGLTLRFQKLRGHNGHHIVESAFKAFSRSLRCFIDGTKREDLEGMWGTSSDSATQGVEMKREGCVTRKTKETGIKVNMALDGGVGGVKVCTGVHTLDGLIREIAVESECMSLQVECQGDLWVDDHHTSEDVSIAIGQVLNKALGSKAGLNRMWTASAEEGASQVEVVMDLSNRPCFTHDLDLSHYNDEKIGDVSVEMIEHVFDSLVMNGQMTVHIVQIKLGQSTKDLVTAAARAFGRALGKCIAVDPRRMGATASSKGTLSV